jgi:hypothetical protein
LIHGLLAADSQPVSSYPPAYLGILGILGTLAASSPASPAGVFYRRCLLPPVSFTAGVLYRHSQINYFFSSTEMKCTLCQIAVQGSVKQFA